MANLVLIKQAKEHSSYTLHHIRYLIRNNLVRGEQIGRIWLVDLDDLIRYESEMEKQGPSKFRPKSLDTTED
jgi:hypothetical protein